VYEVNSSDGPDENTSSGTCHISKQFDASRFHRDLTGSAFLRLCGEQSIYKRDKKKNTTSQSKKLFLDRLGVWLRADAVSPREAIVQSDKPIPGFSNWKSFIDLESFAPIP
jgi:hypothetical protein